MAEKVKKTGKKKTGKKREKVNAPVGMVHVLASFNNTVISITDMEGNLLASCSAGAVGFKGSRKGTPLSSSFRMAGTGPRPRSGHGRHGQGHDALHG